MHMRLAKASETGGISGLEFLRTHPVPERRIKVSQVVCLLVSTYTRASSYSTSKNSSLKLTRYVPPAPNVLAFETPLNNFVEA